MSTKTKMAASGSCIAVCTRDDLRMATPGKTAKKEKKKPVIVKTSLNNPYDMKWASLEKGQARFILKTVTEKLDALGLRKNQVRVFRKWGNKKRSKKTAKSTEPIRLDSQESKQAETIQPDTGDSKRDKTIHMDSQESTPNESVQPDRQDSKQAESTQLDVHESKPVEGGWSVKDLRKQLAIGVNEVTKGLEQNELSLVLVCDSVKPPHVTAHLVPLSISRSVPACQVPGLSSSLAPSLGISSVLALGFKRATADFADTVSALAPRIPALGVAWVPTNTPKPEPGVQRPSQVQQPGGSEEAGKRKRKLESSPEDQQKPPVLQPLKVKKIVPNPSKIRKPKKNKTKK